MSSLAMRRIKTSVQTETILFFRNFFGPFFALVFPILMLVLYGSIYGNDPTPYFGGRGAMDVSVPSYAGMVIGVTSLMCFPLSVAEYKELKIYKRFDATPAGKGIVMLAQVLVNFVITLVGIGLLLIGGILLYNVKIEGNYGIVFLAMMLSIAAMFALGFLITAIAKDAKIVNVVSYTLYFVMLFASGASLPIEMFPDGMKTFSKLLPLSHVVELLKAATGGKPLQEYYMNIIVLLGCLAVFGGSAAILHKRAKWD